MNLRKMVFHSCLFIGAMYAFSWALTGTIKDNNNNPLVDAEVFLVNANIKDSTDGSGSFSFSAVPVKKWGAVMNSRFITPMIVSNRLCFNLVQRGAVEYSVYSINGACILHQKDIFDAGEHQVPLSNNGNALAKAVYVVSFKSQEAVATFKYNSVWKNSITQSLFSKTLNSSSSSISVVGAAAESLEVVDTLIITKVVGDVTSKRKIRIFDYKDNINSARYTSSGLQMVILDPSNDNDGDGLTNFEERYVHFTNSELIDTDGDGLVDNSEIKDNTDPRIADYPQVLFCPTGYPLIMAHFSKAIQNDTGMEISSGGDYSHSSGFSSQQEVNANVSVAVMAGFEVSNDPKLSGSITATVGSGFSLTWGQEHSESMSNNWNSAKTITKSEGVTIDGGEIILEVELTNNSSVNITLVDPMIRLTSTDNGLSTLSTLIGELTVYTGDGSSNEVYIPFATGSNKVTREFRIVISNPDILEQVARNSFGFKAQLTNIRFKTSLGEIDTLMANVYRRTTEVTVDFGQALTAPNNLIKNRVASRAVYNDFYTDQTDRYISTNIFELIKATGVKPVSGTDGEKCGLVEINGVKNGTLKNGSWSIVSQITTDSLQVFSTKIASYNPADLRVGQSSIISCIYDSDIDGDGLSTRLEAVLGTDDTNVDSDGDSLSDKEEFAGWHRSSDPANVTWKTNPLYKDSDFDSLLDPVDPDPLSAAIDPLDSIVSFFSIILTSAQGTAWIDTIKIRDTVSSISTNSLMRGPATLSMKFTHPVFSVSVLCKNTSDTIRITKPDNTGFYNANLNLTLGENEIIVTAISRNGYQTKKVLLSGIQRRLARIDPTKAEFFTVSLPAVEQYGIKMNYYVNYEKISALDPLINRVLVVRTEIYGLPTDSAIKALRMTADDLGDAGDGVANLAAGSIVTGKDGNKNTYKVVQMLNTTNTNTFIDTGLLHQNNYAYFPYSACIGGGKQYHTAPAGLTGIYKTNNRDICIDSVKLIHGVVKNWCGSSISCVYPWWIACQGTIQVGNSVAARDSARNVSGGHYKNGSVVTIINCQGRPMLESEKLWFGGYLYEGVNETNFRAKDGTIWEDVTGMPANGMSIYQIIAPQNNSTIEHFTYKNYADCGFSEMAFVGPGFLYSDSFSVAFEVFWHYRYNSQSQ